QPRDRAASVRARAAESDLHTIFRAATARARTVAAYADQERPHGRPRRDPCRTPTRVRRPARESGRCADGWPVLAAEHAASAGRAVRGTRGGRGAEAAREANRLPPRGERAAGALQLPRARAATIAAALPLPGALLLTVEHI